jgi:hypothetical protein
VAELPVAEGGPAAEVGAEASEARFDFGDQCPVAFGAAVTTVDRGLLAAADADPVRVLIHVLDGTPRAAASTDARGSFGALDLTHSGHTDATTSTASWTTSPEVTGGGGFGDIL